MTGPAKKAIVRTVSGSRHFGYLAGAGFVSGGSVIELLDLAGRIVSLALADVRSIAFVRDFNTADAADPERLTRRTFLARPRSEGLWIRLTLTDGEQMEGLAPLDLSLLDGVLNDRGLHLVPPDTRANTQRLYVPRTAIVSLQLVAVVTTPTKASRAKAAGSPRPAQDVLFPPEEELQSAP